MGEHIPDGAPGYGACRLLRYLHRPRFMCVFLGHPRVINTDKAPSLPRAISELKSEGICPPTVEHRQVKYLNNILEGDRGRLKRILGPKGAFKNLDICISDVERDGGDALIAERARHDV